MTFAVMAGLSLSEQMKTLGAWAGFAAVLGLAVLTVLFVAQARELKRLRDWAGAAPERAAQERRAQLEAEQAQSRAAYQPRVQPAPAAPEAAVAAAPAVSVAGKAAAAGDAAKAVAASGSAPTKESGAPAVAAPGEAKANGTVKGDAVAAGAAAGGAASKAAPQTAGAGGAPAAKEAVQAAGAGGGPAAKVAPQTAAAGGPPPPLLTTSGVRGGRNPLALVAGAVAVVLVAVFLATRLFGGDDSSPTSAPVAPQPASQAPSGPAGGAIRPTARRRIVVAVLNGTTTTGLARGAADRLQSRGYRIGQVTNATDQSRTASSVAYAAGYRRAAIDVARIVRASIGTVRPMDAATRVVAGEDAMVVVTVGADQST